MSITTQATRLFSVIRAALKSAMRISCTQNAQPAKQRCGGNDSNDQVVVARGSMMTNLKREHPEPGQPHNHPVDQAQIRLAKVKARWKMKLPYPGIDQARSLVGGGVNHWDGDIRTFLPFDNSCKRIMRNHRVYYKIWVISQSSSRRQLVLIQNNS